MAHRGYRKKRSNNNKSAHHDMLGVVLIIVSVFLLLCIMIPPILSVVSEAVFSIVLGVFGIVAYPALIAMLMCGIFLMLRRAVYMSVKNVVCTILLIFFGLIILQLATTHAFLDQGYSAYISDVYAAKYSMGGVVMGTIAFGLKSIISEPGCYIVFSLGILVVVCIMAKVVSRIRARRRRAAAPQMAKMPPAPGFATRTDPQNVMPVATAPGLFVGTIEHRSATPISVETGRASEIAESEPRAVTDYYDSPVMLEPDISDRRADKKSVSAAQMTLYGDSDAIKRKSVEEYMRSIGESKQAPDRSPVREHKESDKPDGAVVEPYVRAAADAKANVASAQPKKIVHETHDVFFPIEKNPEFNDEGIEDADDIKRRLREDAQKRKRGVFDFSDAQSDERKRPSADGFMSIKRVEPPAAPVNPIAAPPESTVERNDAPIIDADSARKSPLDGNDRRSDALPPPATKESVDEKFMRAFGDAGKDMPLYEPEPVRDEIINTDIIRGTSFAQEPAPENSDVDPDDIIIGDVPENDWQTDKSESVLKPAPSAAMTDGDDIVDGSNNNANIVSDGIKLGGLTIADGPAVDMTQKHDITSDLIDGEDLSGMYVSADDDEDGDDDAPAQKPSRSRKGVMPLDNQISMQSVLEQKSEETVVMTPRKRHKQYTNYIAPPLDLLKKYQSDDMSEDDLNRNASILETVISGFLKSEVKVVRIVPGPTVTRYEIECPMGVPVKQIETHSQDIEYELAALSHIRIEAPIPGKRAVGIEVPNAKKSIVGIREIIESDEFAKAKSPMTFAVGKGISGDVVVCDLEKVPHLLIAGQTGSGKSACLNGLIVSLLYKSSPEDLRFVLVDPKRVEFSAYAGMPHLLFNNIIYEPNEVLNALKWGVNEMERRYALLQKYKCNQLSAFNKHPDVVSGKIDRLPHIIIIIDELADIMQSVVKRDIEEKIKTIAAKARAAGIHLIVATQRPSADVLTGTIKTNLTSRIAFKVSGQTDSRIILDVQGAEALVGKGDMLFFPVDYSAPKRVQGSFISDEEVASVIGHIRDNVECDFDDDAQRAVFGSADGGSADAGLQKAKDDPLLADVLALVIRTKQASTSGIQRRFSIGYARASRIMDIMEEMKYIGPATGNSKPREVFITNEQYRELFGYDVDDNN